MRRIYRGWSVVLGAVAGQTFSLGTMLVFTFGVLVKPLANELGATRGAIALAVSMLDIVVTFSAAGAGRLVDRWGARPVIVSSMMALAACIVGLSFVTPPVWHLYALYALAGLVGVASSPVSYARVIANWFDRRRGLALGIAGSGIGIGAFVMPPLTQLFIDRWGWRGAYLGLAAASVVIALPIVAATVRGSPEEVGLAREDVSTNAPTVETTARRARSTPMFWQLCAVFFCVAACVNGAAAHLVPLLTNRGLAPRAGAIAASFFGVLSLVGKLATGYLLDRFPAPRVAAAMFGGATLGIALLYAQPDAFGTPFVAPILLGLAIGAESDVMPYLVSRMFGVRSMAELFGYTFGSYTLGNATGRYLFAAGFDAAGSYRTPLACALVAMLVATGATLRLRVSVRPAAAGAGAPAT